MGNLEERRESTDDAGKVGRRQENVAGARFVGWDTQGWIRRDWKRGRQTNAGQM